MIIGDSWSRIELGCPLAHTTHSETENKLHLNLIKTWSHPCFMAIIYCTNPKMAWLGREGKKKFLPSSQAKIKWVNDLCHWAWVSTIGFRFMRMNSLMVCLYTTINPWLFTINSVSTPISQAYDSLAIVKLSHPEKKTFFSKKCSFFPPSNMIWK